MALGATLQELEQEIQKEVVAGVFAVDIISSLKPIGILIWAFVSQLYVKGQKVSSVLTLKSSYLALMAVWTLLVLIQIGLSLEFVYQVKERQ